MDLCGTHEQAGVGASADNDWRQTLVDEWSGVRPFDSSATFACTSDSLPWWLFPHMAFERLRPKEQAIAWFKKWL
jgi:hypothetical protein